MVDIAYTYIYYTYTEVYDPRGRAPHLGIFPKVALDPEISASDLLQQDLITEAAKKPVEVIGGS